jgi:hypothetical protein
VPTTVVLVTQELVQQLKLTLLRLLITQCALLLLEFAQELDIFRLELATTLELFGVGELLDLRYRRVDVSSGWQAPWQTNIQS